MTNRRTGWRRPHRARWFGIGLVVLWVVGSAAAAERLAVTNPIANIRGGPGTSYDVLWQVERYHPIDVIERRGKWIKFRDYEGDQGWIHQSLLGRVPTVITTARSNVRNGPGLDHGIRFTVEDGVPFKILDRRGSWYHVEHADGDRGWIHRSLVWR